MYQFWLQYPILWWIFFVLVPSDFLTFVCIKLLTVIKNKSNMGRYISIIKKLLTSALITLDFDVGNQAF